MLKNKLTTNKFYLYAGNIVKLKKINKKQNKIYIEKLDNGEVIELTYEQHELILYRIYTVGEVAKIVEKRADTIRKYEKKMLIPDAKKFGEKYKGYADWRYYSEDDVYSMVEFFNTRVPGRPVAKELNIKPLAQKVQMKIKDSNVRTS
jgi:RNA recognition motif-containing protein